MRKFIPGLLAAGFMLFAASACPAAILFTYSVAVDGGSTAFYSQSSGAASIMTVSDASSSFLWDGSGPGTDIDIADISVVQTPASTAFSVYNGSTSSYTFDITITDATSGMSGVFTVKGKVKGKLRSKPGFSYGFGNEYLPGFAPNERPLLLVGNSIYRLDYPVFSSDFVSPAPFGSWTFHVQAVVPEPGVLPMILGACGSAGLLVLRSRRNRADRSPINTV